MTDEPNEVTQADREATKRIQQRFLTEGISHNLVLHEELAAHRIQSTTALQAKLAAAEKMAEALEEARLYVQNVWEAGGDEFTRRKMVAIDAALTEWKDTQ